MKNVFLCSFTLLLNEELFFSSNRTDFWRWRWHVVETSREKKTTCAIEIIRPLFYHFDHFDAMKTLELYEKNIQLISEREIFFSSRTSENDCSHATIVHRPSISFEIHWLFSRSHSFVYCMLIDRCWRTARVFLLLDVDQSDKDRIRLLNWYILMLVDNNHGSSR